MAVGEDGQLGRLERVKTRARQTKAADRFAYACGYRLFTGACEKSGDALQTAATERRRGGITVGIVGEAVVEEKRIHLPQGGEHIGCGRVNLGVGYGEPYAVGHTRHHFKVHAVHSITSI